MASVGRQPKGQAKKVPGENTGPTPVMDTQIANTVSGPKPEGNTRIGNAITSPKDV